MISKSFSKRFGLFGDSLNNFRTFCFSQARNLFRDMKEEKKDRCPHCFKEFTNLRHHVNQQHIQVNLSFRFGRESLTNMPLLISPPIFYFQLKNFKCGDCGYTCYLKTDLERHIMNVHDKFRSPCPSCGKKYSDLRQHIRVVHEGAKVG